MPLFRKPKRPAPSVSPKAAPTGPQVPPFSGDPTALRFSKQLEAGQWAEFHDFVAGIRDPDLRYFYLESLTTLSGRPGWLDEWVAACPGSALPVMFRGRHAIKWAWDARGSGRAKTVKEDAWPVFHRRLVVGDADLARAAELDPDDPAPHAFSIWAAMGLSLGQQEVRRRYDQAAKREPFHTGAAYAMIQATARKWGGSHEAMFAFARDLSGRAPEGHSAHKVIALAHIEAWLDRSAEKQRTYFSQPAVKDEVRAAAARSIRSPRYQVADSVLQWSDRNAFAFCFRQMGDWDAQLAQMEIIGTRITQAPWQYLSGGAGAAYERARQHAVNQAAILAADAIRGRR